MLPKAHMHASEYQDLVVESLEMRLEFGLFDFFGDIIHWVDRYVIHPFIGLILRGPLRLPRPIFCIIPGPPCSR